MQIKERVASNRGEVRHIAADGDVCEKVRVLIEPGAEPKAAGRHVDVQFLIEAVETQPVHVERVDALTPIDPGMASAVKERAARIAKYDRDREIGLVSGDRIPIGKREVIIVQHLAKCLLKLVEHQAMPGQEVPLLILLRIIWI